MSATQTVRSLEADPLLPVYLREMGENDLIDHETEMRLAGEFQTAKSAIADIARALPAPLRKQVLAHDPAGVRNPREWEVSSVRRFASELGKIDAGVAPAVRKELARQLAAMERAREEMTLANLRLVVHLARRYVSKRLPLMDLIQEGNVGLMRAVDKYDARRGHKFSTYAYWWIKQCIERAIAEKSRLVRLPVHANDRQRKARRTARTLEQQLGRPATLEEVADRIEIPVDQLREITAADRPPTSLDDPGNPESSATLEIPDESATGRVDGRLDWWEAHQRIAQALRTNLDPREESIVRLRFGLNGDRALSLEDIGRRIGLSRERVRQLEARAIDKLRTSDALGELLGTLGAA